MIKSRIIAIIVGIVTIGVGILIISSFVKDDKKEVVLNTDNLTSIKIDNDLLNYQLELENAYLEDFKNQNYTLENPKIIINPYEISPLTALVMFKTESEVSTTITVKGHDESGDISKTFSKTKEHIIPVFGLYADYDNSVVLTTSDGKSKTINIKTEFIETELFGRENLKLNVLEKNNEKIGDEFYFMTSPLLMSSMAYDTNGDLRWYLTKSYFKDVQRLNNGHLLLSNDELNIDFAATGMVEIDLFGKIYNYYNIETGYHNDYYIKEDGNIIIASNNPNSDTLNDYIIELNRNTGKNVKEIDLYKILSDIDSDFMKSLDRDWGYNNSVFYNKETDELILSYWYRGTVISIDYSESKLNWMFSDPSHWSEKFANYLLKPTSIDFVYPQSLHAAKLKDNNTLTLFDNGFDYLSNNVSCESIKNDKSLALEYKIDKENKTITKVWSFGEDKNLFSYALGDYDSIGNKKYILFGREFVDMNYDDPTCNVDNYMDLRSYIYELDNNEVIFEAYLNNASYRISKFSLYNDKDNYHIGAGKYFSNYKETSAKEIDKEYVEKLLAVTNINEIDITYDGGILTLNSIFPKDEEVKIILVDKYGDGYIYNYKEKGNADVLSVVPKTDTTYSIFLEINGNIYKTNKKIG